MRALRNCIVLILTILQTTNTVDACTIVSLEGASESVVIKNYEWGPRNAAIFFNPVGLQKSSVIWNKRALSAAWSSRFVSITLNSLGRDYPEGGINEKGLVVESAVHMDTYRPWQSERPSLNEFSFVQYLLDTAGSLTEALEQARRVDVAPLGELFHYLVCDAQNLCAVIEYGANGLRMYHYYNNTLVVPTLTAAPYRNSTEFLSEHIGFGGGARIPQGPSPLERFVQASYYSREYRRRPEGVGTCDYAFYVARSLRMNTTKWQAVYFSYPQPKLHVKKPEQRRYDVITFDGLPRRCGGPLLMRSFPTGDNGRGSEFRDDQQAYSENLLKDAARALPWLQNDRLIEDMSHRAYSAMCQSAPSYE